jgi:hypothetical protein
MKVKIQVKANIDGDFRGLTIEGLRLIIDDDKAYINDIPIPKEIGNYVIDRVSANTVSHEANLKLEIEDYGLIIEQGDKEILTIEFHWNKAVLLTPKRCYELKHADKLKESLQKVSAYV